MSADTGQASMNSDLPNGPKAVDTCDHHWISSHHPGLAIYWLVTCSQCGAPNIDEVNQQIRDLRHPARAWLRKLRDHAEVTSWPWAIRAAARRCWS